MRSRQGMFLLHRSSKRRLAGLERPFGRRGQCRPQTHRDCAREPFAKHSPAEVDRFHFQCRSLPLLRAAVRDVNSSCKEDPDLNIPRDASSSSLVKQTGHTLANSGLTFFKKRSVSLSATGELERPISREKRRDAFKLSLYRSEIGFPNAYKCRMPSDAQLLGDCKVSKLKRCGTNLYRGVPKRDFHTLLEKELKAESKMMHVSMFEGEEMNCNREYRDEVEEAPDANVSDKNQNSNASLCNSEVLDNCSFKMIEQGGQNCGKLVSYLGCQKDEDSLQGPALNEKSAQKKHKEHLNRDLYQEYFPKLTEVHEDSDKTFERLSRQDSFTEKEPKVQDRGLCLREVSSNEGSGRKDDTSLCFTNRDVQSACNDLEAVTSRDSFANKWMNAQGDKSVEGFDRGMHDIGGVLKDRYPIRGFNVNPPHLILDLNGVLIKRWEKNPSLPGVVKLNKRWIQLRPGCIEFLHKVFCAFKVGIWSTMTDTNVLGVCKLLEQHANRSLPFFMLWSKEFCYHQQGVHRPDKSYVLADFKPLSHVWKFFEPYLGYHNTVLIDDSPYKACMNNPYNCIFPNAYEGCTDDNYLIEVLWPYLENMRMSQNLQAFIANNPLGQPAVVLGHRLYNHVQSVVDNFNQVYTHERW